MSGRPRRLPLGFEWDEPKNQANIQKHGIDFRDAIRVFEYPTLDRVDRRQDYGEVRVNSVGELDGVCVANVTHTDREGRIRLISARAATAIERIAYTEFRRELTGKGLETQNRDGDESR